MILWEKHLEEALREDGWPWDWTTLSALSAPNARSYARIVAKSDGVWAPEGIFDAAEAISKKTGYPLEIRPQAVMGREFKKGEVIAEWSGPAAGILALERPILNLAAYSCGIATATRAIVKKIESLKLKKPPRVTSTRKTLPGYRDISLQAVMAGGGFSHRVSLSGGVLIKENHIAAAGGIAQAVLLARATAPHVLKIETEVRNLSELKDAMTAKVDGVLLDNFSPPSVREAVQFVQASKQSIFIEVSGGVTLENVSDFAVEGVDVISVGSVTHSVRAVDLSLLFQ